jgi:choline-sulfatase
VESRLFRWVPAVPFLLAVAAASCGRLPSRPRTVVLLSVDTLRADRLGVYGATSPRTPVIDELGREARVFEKAWTVCPVTLPAHASMLTGLLPPRHAVRTNVVHQLGDGVPLATETFQRHGYRTGGFIGGYPLYRTFGLARGFDHYDDRLSPAALESHYPQRRAMVVVEQALSWIGVQGQAPVFVFVHLYDPHADYSPPPPYDREYASRPYEGEVAYVDAAVGRLRKGLEDLGRWNDAVFLLVSDHGEGLGEHGEDTHGVLLYESTLRIPFLVRGPGITPGRSGQPVSLVDVAPTLLARAGLPALEDVDGADVLALNDGRRDLYAETLLPYLSYGWAGLRALRRGEWKLIDGPAPELYDLEADPAESRTAWPSEPGESLQRAVRAASAAARPQTSSPDLDEAAHEALHSLGYVASTADVPSDFGIDRADPRSRIGILRALEDIAPLGPEAWQEAVRRLEGLAREDPGNSVIRRRIGTRRLKAGDFEGAIREYRHAVRLANGSPDVQRALVNAYYQAGLDSLKKRRLAEARERLRRAAEGPSERADIFIALARAEAMTGHVEESIAAFQRTLRVDPQRASAWFELGLVLESAGRSEEAVSSYRRFLDVETSASPRRDYAESAVKKAERGRSLARGTRRPRAVPGAALR